MEMSGSVQPGYAPYRFGPAGWRSQQGGCQPLAFLWSVPKPLLIGGMVLGFIAFWPVGLVILGALIGSGRIGGRRWARRAAMMQGAAGGGCGWRGWGRAEPGSGNRAFDEYRQETLRRLEEEQGEFATFLERLRFAKDKAEFDQFMAERRQRPAPPPPPAAPEPQPQPQG
jgi:hypothetical protein